MSTTTYDRGMQDVGNILSFDHLNLTVPDQQTATLFYIVGLGFTRDPYMTVGLENMWVNAGRQQFHLPTSSQPQRVRGHIGLVVPNLDQLRERLGRIAPGLQGTAFTWADRGEAVAVTCPWGNQFICTEDDEGFGGTRLGMPHVQLDVPEGAAPGIARFYAAVMGAPADVRDVDGAQAAVVRVGRGQSLVFREAGAGLPAYDGHHIAVYLADFSSPHGLLRDRGLVTEESNEWQYRFTDIVDLETGKPLYQLEHEVRSMHHPMYQRPLVNRDAGVDTRNYVRGADALVVG